MKKFKFVMLMFFLVFATAGITFVALAFGDEKAVNVGTDRKEFDKLYNAYDQLNNKYFQGIDTDDLVNGAIDGMVKALGDPYSDYMTMEESTAIQRKYFCFISRHWS